MDGDPVRILVVDDERHIVRLLQVNLERNGYKVTPAFSGKEALELLTNHSFDRVIVDYDMPGMTGYQVLEFIRTNEKFKNLWVLLMIKSSKDRELIKSFPHKADSYGEKPFNPVDWMS